MISVCMATHKGERLVEKQMVSILKQLEQTFELIVSESSTINILKLSVPCKIIELTYLV